MKLSHVDLDIGENKNQLLPTPSLLYHTTEDHSGARFTKS